MMFGGGLREMGQVLSNLPYRAPKLAHVDMPTLQNAFDGRSFCLLDFCMEKPDSPTVKVGSV